ncbi:hypothetical protein M885DRAFT_426400, partial [Pelagophyceae sp. CCMP2097]
GQLVVARFHGAALLLVQRCVGFDFDGTLSDRRNFTCGPNHFPQYDHCAAVLRRLHAEGNTLFIATKESVVHLRRGSAAAQKQLGDKLRRLEAFAALLGPDVPILVFV